MELADSAHDTALHLAARGGHVDCIKLLTSHPKPPKPDVRNKRSETPLVAAINAGKTEAVAALEAVGANPQLQLLYAAAEGKEELLRDILQKGRVQMRQAPAEERADAALVNVQVGVIYDVSRSM